MSPPIRDQLSSPSNPAHLARWSGERPTIGFLTASLADPYSTFTWSGVLDVARERNVNVLNLVGSRLRSSAALEEPAQVMFDLVDPALLDGLVVFSEMLYHFVSVQELQQFLLRYSTLPKASIGEVEGIPSVMLDKELGMQQMIEHLVEVHGYRRLAYLSGPAGEQTAEALYRGYLKGLALQGIPFDSTLVTPNQPNWGNSIGTEGVRVLLDERYLKPGLDFECIVGCGDREGLAAVDALQSRGLRVPYDVAVTGFNNLEHAHLASTSLTTVDRRVIEAARRATKMLLDALDGQAVAQSDILAPELIVRRSCGCIPETVRQAASDPSATKKPAIVLPTGAPLRGDKEQIFLEIAKAMRPRSVGYLPDLNCQWTENLFNSFISEMDGDSPGLFLTVLEEILRQAITADQTITAWQGVLSAMRRSMRPYLGDADAVERAEDLWQQARTLLGDFAVRDQGYRRLNETQQVQIFNSIIQRLMATFDVDGIMDVLARDLPQLGIPSCYLSLYEDSSLPTGWARLWLAYDDLGRIPVQPGGIRFSSRSLIPPQLMRGNRRRDLVGLPLHFHGEHIGFVILEMGPRDGKIYEALRMPIGTALKAAFLATSNEELYREAVDARREAEAANRMKSRFLSTVSHELRTPLSLIVGTIEMQLREDANSEIPLPDRFRRDLNNIRASAHHLNHLIGDVLDLTSSHAGQLRLVREQLRLGEVLPEVIALGEAMAREKGLAWHTDIPADLPFVWGDRTRLQQVTLNLISNAVKFTQSGTITLWTEVGKDQLLLAVTDTGLGIPVEDQSIIFDEFYQSERMMNQAISGKGLGLAISRRLVELHGGQIGVLSSGMDGSGSTVYFTLPIMDWANPEPTPPLDRSSTVLILTEQGAASTSVRDHLLSRGFTVELVNVTTSARWREGIIASPPAAVVLDYKPAGERGWELMRELREYLPNQDIPVVFYSLSEDLNHGAILDLDYLIKPVSSSDLAHALARQGLKPAESADCQTILIVDDDPGILELHERMLEKLVPRCQIIKAHNGREALEIMAERRPDLVLLDLVMPILDGFAVLQAMRERELTHDVPVIVLTAQLLTEHDMVRLQQGVATILAKGLYTSTEMVDQIEAVLNRNKHIYSDTQRAMRQTMAYIHENYTNSISRTELAARIGLSDRYLTQCFRQETGLTPIKYLSRYRIRQSRALLERGEMNITEIALAVGFTDPSYFARVFRDEVGLSPRAYQNGERPSDH